MVNLWQRYGKLMVRLSSEDQIENGIQEAQLPPFLRVSVAIIVAFVCNVHHLMHHIWKLVFLALTFANIATETRRNV